MFRYFFFLSDVIILVIVIENGIEVFVIFDRDYSKV